MARRRRKAAGPSAVTAPLEAPIAWPDHPLAASGGEILAARILPLMGHNARDFARAAAVCRGWRAACQAASATLSVYREITLPPFDDRGHSEVNLMWSPCGNFVAATVCYPPRLFIWRASTGALVNDWALATPATAIPPNRLPCVDYVHVTFSRDSTRVLTHFEYFGHFAVWSVPDGQLLAVNQDDDDFGSLSYGCVDFGVPGSASEGLVIFGVHYSFVAELWEVAPPPEGGGSHSEPRLRSRVDLRLAPDEVPSEEKEIRDLSLSQDGSKFAATCGGVAHVYDVASLTRLGAYTSPSRYLGAATWAPDSQHLLLAWGNSACVWDFSRPEAPSVVTADVGPDAHFHSWSPSGASYFVVRQLKGRTRNGPPSHALEERRAADGSLLRAVNLGTWGSDYPSVVTSPDAHALMAYRYDGGPARVIVFA